MAKPTNKPKFSFDQAIRVIARQRGWTLKKTAYFAGVPMGTLRQCMEGSNTYITTIERYANIFGMTVPEFYAKGLAPW